MTITNKIIEIISVDVDLIDKEGTTHYIATAILEDVYKVRTSLLDPAEWRPGQCSGGFEVPLDSEHPPLKSEHAELLSYLVGQEIDWRCDDEGDDLYMTT